MYLYSDPNFVKAILKKLKLASDVSDLSISKSGGISGNEQLLKYEVRNSFNSKIVLWVKKTSLEVFKLISYIQGVKQKKFSAPEAVYYNPKDNFLIYKESAGKSLRKYEKSNLFWENNISSVAEVLKDFQKLRPRFFRERTLAAEKKFLNSRCRSLKKHKIRGWNNLCAECLDYAPKIFKADFALCHGDFQPSNIIYNIKSKKFGLIDFDSAEYFNPLSDWANFGIHVNVMLRHNFSGDKINSWIKKFNETYFDQAPLFKKEITADKKYFCRRSLLDIAATTLALVASPLERKKIFSIIDAIERNLSLFLG